VKDPDDEDPMSLASSAFCSLSPAHVCDDHYDCRGCAVARGRSRS
jgi:hypothetical protein